MSTVGCDMEETPPPHLAAPAANSVMTSNVLGHPALFLGLWREVSSTELISR